MNFNKRKLAVMSAMVSIIISLNTFASAQMCPPVGTWDATSLPNGEVILGSDIIQDSVGNWINRVTQKIISQSGGEWYPGINCDCEGSCGEQFKEYEPIFPEEDCYKLANQDQYEIATSICLSYAVRGIARAQTAVGRFYFNGFGFEKNLDLASYWYELAAEQGNEQAALRLGLMHLELKADEFERDYSKALKYLLPLADSGIVMAQSAIGEMYFLGDGVEIDDLKAEKYLRLAAMQGDKRAQEFLAGMYMAGRGVEFDVVQGYMWNFVAAENGNSEAAQGRIWLRAFLSDEEIQRATEMAGRCLLSGYQDCGVN